MLGEQETGGIGPVNGRWGGLETGRLWLYVGFVFSFSLSHSLSFFLFFHSVSHSIPRSSHFLCLSSPVQKHRYHYTGWRQTGGNNGYAASHSLLMEKHGLICYDPLWPFIISSQHYELSQLPVFLPNIRGDLQFILHLAYPAALMSSSASPLHYSRPTVVHGVIQFNSIQFNLYSAKTIK